MYYVRDFLHLYKRIFIVHQTTNFCNNCKICLPESHEHTDFVHLGLGRLLVVQSDLAAAAPVPLQHLQSDGKIFMGNVKIYSASAYL